MSTRQAGSGRSFDGYVGSATTIIMAGWAYHLRYKASLSHHEEFLENMKRKEEIRQALKEEEIKQAIESDQLSSEALEDVMREASTADIFVTCFKKKNEIDFPTNNPYANDPYGSWRFFSLAEFIERASANEIRILWDLHRTEFDKKLLLLFWLAAAANKGIAAKDLKNAHIDIDTPLNRIEKTFLHDAVHSRDSATVKGLLKAGADINARNCLGETALFYAVWHSSGKLKKDGFWYSNSDKNSNEITQALLTAGADVNAKNDKNETALHYAAELGKYRKTCVATLLKAGADTNAMTNSQDTPLHYACMAQVPSVATVWLLLWHGARPDAQNVNSKLPADLLCHKNEMLGLFRRIGIKETVAELCRRKFRDYTIRTLLKAYACMQAFQEA